MARLTYSFGSFSRSSSASSSGSPAGRSAIEYYDALYADTNFIPLRGFINERLSIALMDSVQQAINAYLKTDPGELA